MPHSQMPHSSVAALSVQNDSSLVKTARCGNEDAIQVLLTRYEPFIRERCKIAAYSGIEADDLMQEGRLGLVSAVKLYDDGAGASFKTFAFKCIINKINSAVRGMFRPKNIPLHNYVPIEECEAEAGKISAVNPEDVVISHERILAVKEVLGNLFSPFERRLFSQYLSGFSYEDIAADLNISKKQVDNSLQRIKRKLGMIFT